MKGNQWNAADADFRDQDILTAAVKADDSKPRYDLIPPEALEALAEILTFGAAKYAPRNWECGFRWGRVFAALMRHLWAWWARSGPDAETGRSHLWHALACLVFLIAFEARATGEDDRP
ncbi:dATP/dGTP diphosphohydrolase domain-containing protein [Pararhodobacter zhoushanensis]|uniref:dATP/dGTP diphosphohydrolase domain-containing protein n=1 Tax=Pararhodobacter zhoushanensis TaxID=2479545 RepID=UPI000F8EB30F|nr:dATP/dGTP diphosphohydrolase domain-containing protein [Pararhodobacter zhoushanensis]